MISFRLETKPFEIAITLGNTLKRRTGVVVFDEVVLDARFIGVREDALPVNDAAADFGHFFHGTAEVLSLGGIGE